MQISTNIFQTKNVFIHSHKSNGFQFVLTVDLKLCGHTVDDVELTDPEVDSLCILVAAKVEIWLIVSSSSDGSHVLDMVKQDPQTIVHGAVPKTVSLKIGEVQDYRTNVSLIVQPLGSKLLS